MKGMALDLATRWLDAMAADPRPLSFEKVVADKPADAKDTCWTPEGTKLVEIASLEPGARCNQLYPPHLEPRMIAGEGLTNDVWKCQLQAPARAMYPATMTDAEFIRIKEVFTQGVCDYRRPGVGYTPYRGPLAALGTAKGQ
jgi:hypothetical protein